MDVEVLKWESQLIFLTQFPKTKREKVETERKMREEESESREQGFDGGDVFV